MLLTPNCFKRECKHYIGVIQPDGTELTETNICKAFPKSIPREIAYGPHKHTRPLPEQDNKIVFQEEE